MILAAALAARAADYRFAFTILIVPGILAMAALLVARRMLADPGHSAEPDTPDASTASSGSSGEARTYLGFVFFSALGFTPFPLIAFHISDRAAVGEATIPLMFALAMAVDGAVALISGRIYDRRGLRVLTVMPLLSVLTVLAFTTTVPVVWVGAAVWGAVMGIQESTLRAAVGDLAATRRATAYGVFNAVYGVGLLGGGVMLGLLYDRSVASLVVAVVAMQITAGGVLYRLVGTRHGSIERG